MFHGLMGYNNIFMDEMNHQKKGRHTHTYTHEWYEIYLFYSFTLEFVCKFVHILSDIHSFWWPDLCALSTSNVPIILQRETRSYHILYALLMYRIQIYIVPNLYKSNSIRTIFSSFFFNKKTFWWHTYSVEKRGMHTVDRAIYR